ncbi:FadR/GntR family transcriptional regulator [Methylobacterium crusticola]|nr:FadR/GntR family transcriptional regulator [Methylobacterium crusticola]
MLFQPVTSGKLGRAGAEMDDSVGDWIETTESSEERQGGNLQLPQRFPVSHDAVRRIQEMIASGTLAPGDNLPPQRELAASLGVSRPSLREALSVLETLGFIEIQPGRRAVVCQPHAEHGAPPRWRFQGRFSQVDVFQFRLLIETFTARLAATRVSPTEVAELRANVEEMKRAIRASDLELSARIDAEFHAKIIGFSGNKLFPEVYAMTDSIILEAHRLPLLARDRLWEPVDEHVDIVKAFDQHDPDGAGYYMRLHLMRTATRSGIEGRFDNY